MLMDYRRKTSEDWSTSWDNTARFESWEGFYHLTPDGWRRADQEPFPRERFETWSLVVCQVPGELKEYRNLRCVWADHAVDRNSRDKFRRQHGWPEAVDLYKRTHTVSKPL
jgi:hypothetical protein